MAIDVNTGGIKLSSAFNLRTPVPLDLRTVRATVIDRDGIPLTYRYEGMPCYVQSNETLYRLKGGIANAYWIPECCRKYNLDAISDPGVSNNESEGYNYGSIWYNTISGNTFLLINFVGGDAVWIQVNGFNWTSVNW